MLRLKFTSRYQLLLDLDLDDQLNSLRAGFGVRMENVLENAA